MINCISNFRLYFEVPWRRDDSKSSWVAGTAGRLAEGIQTKDCWERTLRQWKSELALTFVFISLSVKFLVHGKFCSVFVIGLYLCIWSSLSHTKWISLESAIFGTTFLIGMLKSAVLLLLLRWGFFILCMYLFWKPFRRKENPIKSFLEWFFKNSYFRGVWSSALNISIMDREAFIERRLPSFFWLSEMTF